MKNMLGLLEFIAVVEQGSFTAAAKTLDRSTAFVSRRVAALERRLGARLMHRTTRRVELTELGTLYHAEASALLAGFDALELDLANRQNLVAGPIRIAAGGRFGEGALAAALADFSKTYPKVDIELDLDTRRRDVIADGYDLAIRHANPGAPGLIARKLTDRRMLVCGAPAYFARRRKPKKPADLTGHNCITSAEIPWQFAEEGTLFEQKVTGNWRTNNGEACLQAVLAGIGLARLAEAYVATALAEGQLEVVLQRYEVPPSTTYLVYPDREFMANRVRVLIDFLIERFR